jgi:diphthamide biosynthesis methyltransferase
VRTTLTLDSDVEAMLKKLMRERGLSFKEAVNSSLRRALAPAARADVNFPTYAMGESLVDTTHALRLAAALEDEEIVREISVLR